MEKVATYVRVSNHSSSQEALYKQKVKVKEYCQAQGYAVVDAIDVVGDRKLGYPMLIKLIESAKEKGIDKIVMTSTNRIVGTLDELREIRKLFEESGIRIETMDGSHEAVNTKDLIVEFLARATEENEMNEGQDDGEQGSPVLTLE